VDLAVLIDFDNPGEASAFMAVDLPNQMSKLSVTDAIQDGDVVRLQLHLDDVSTSRLKATKRALVNHWHGRAFVKLDGRYTAWHSRELSNLLAVCPLKI
jgi:hypothetical protein